MSIYFWYVLQDVVLSSKDLTNDSYIVMLKVNKTCIKAEEKGEI